MNKRALMLSAAIAVALTTPALAAAPVDAVATTAQKTSALPNPLTITSAGGIKLTSGTAPLLTIDSNSVINNAGTFTFTDTTSAIGVLIDGTKNSIGSFDNNGTIDLTGTGTAKNALHLSGTGSFTGTITFDTLSNVKVAGDQCIGIKQDAGFVLNGDLVLGGTLAMTPTAANGTAASSIKSRNLPARSTATCSSTPARPTPRSATRRTASRFRARSCRATRPRLRPARRGLLRERRHHRRRRRGDAFSDGRQGRVGLRPHHRQQRRRRRAEQWPDIAIDTVANALISANGVVSPVLLIAPALSAGNITLGVDTDDAANGTFGFINRGSITAVPEDSNQNVRDIVISGATAQTITINGGFFSSGLISAAATSIAPGNAVSATAMEIDSFVNIPEIEISGQSAASTNNNGLVSATINGPEGGIAAAIVIAGQPVSGVAVTSVPSITIDTGARVIASATVTDPTNTAVTQLAAIGIEDRSNSLVTLNNAGTISATATTLTNGHTSIAHAVDTSFNSVGLTFTNNGTVTGDVLLGGGADTYTIQGTGRRRAIATQTGDINFGTSVGGSGLDTLNVNNFANVSGAITAQGSLDVQVATNGS